jgi:hypothetical protein
MPSSGMLPRVAFVRTDVSEECISSIIKVKTIGQLGTTLAVTNNRSTLQRNKADSCHPGNGGDTFLRNVDYNSHAV